MWYYQNLLLLTSQEVLIQALKILTSNIGELTCLLRSWVHAVITIFHFLFYPFIWQGQCKHIERSRYVMQVCNLCVAQRVYSIQLISNSTPWDMLFYTSNCLLLLFYFSINTIKVSKVGLKLELHWPIIDLMLA